MTTGGKALSALARYCGADVVKSTEREVLVIEIVCPYYSQQVVPAHL